MVQEKKKHIFMLDILNVLACFGVVCLHVNHSVWAFTPNKRWIFGWLIENVMYWPVPIFFMITGITLLDYRKRYSTAEYLKKRFQKTVIPFLFWSVVSIPYTYMINRAFFADVKFSLPWLLDLIVNCKTMQLYWFFPFLFSVYLSIPFLSMIQEENRKKAYGYLCGYGILTIAVFPLLFRLMNISFNGALQSPICGGYIMFVLLGWLLYHTEQKKPVRLLIYLLGICGFAMRFVGDGIFYWKNNAVSGGVFYGYLKLPCIAFSCAVFVFVKNLDFTKLENSRWGRGISKLSNMSFGVYLIHFFVMQIVCSIINVDITHWAWKIAGSFLIYALSIVTVAVLKKIPIIKKTVP